MMVDRSPTALAWVASHVAVEMCSWRVGRPLFSAPRADGGDGAPTVVFLHGLTASGRYWRRLAASLGDDGPRLHLIDVRGFGRSPWPRVAYTTDNHLAALDAWRVDAGLAGAPIIVVGHSLGALLALAAAARDPTVAGAILIGLPVYPDATEARHRLARLSPLNYLTLTARPLGWAACTAMCCLRPLCHLAAPLVFPRLPPEVARDGALHTWRSLSGTLDRCILDAAVDRLPPPVASPLLLVHGDVDDTAPIDPVRALATRLPLARLVDVPGAGHDLPLSHPDTLAGLIRAFVLDVQQAGSEHPRPVVGDRRAARRSETTTAASRRRPVDYAPSSSP